MVYRGQRKLLLLLLAILVPSAGSAGCMNTNGPGTQAVTGSPSTSARTSQYPPGVPRPVADQPGTVTQASFQQQGDFMPPNPKGMTDGATTPGKLAMPTMLGTPTQPLGPPQIIDAGPPQEGF